MKFERGWVVVVCFAAVSVLSDVDVIAARPMTVAKTTTDSLTEAVIQQAQTMSDASVAHDYAELTDFMYPRLVAALGGRAATIAKMQHDMAAAADADFGVITIRVLHASAPVEAGAELHSLVTCHQFMRGPNVIFRAKTFLVAASSDGGQNWTFVSVPRRRPDAIKSIFPAWNSALSIPTPPEPERVSTDLVVDRNAE
jgi:hypothetical protein